MAELSDADYEAAIRRGEIEMRTRPRARDAHYDRTQDRIVIELVNDAIFSLPARLLEGFDRASPEELAEVEILGAGFGLHWERLDADFTVESLMAGRFGTARYMAERFGAGWDVAAAE